MPVTIPNDASAQLQKALREIEQRLADLEARKGEPASAAAQPKNKSLEDRVGDLEAPAPGPEWSEMVGDGPLHARGLTPDTYENAGFGTERVLHADGTWRRPLDGLIQTIPAAITGFGTRKLEILGALAVASGLSADSLVARLLSVGKITGGLVLETIQVAGTTKLPSEVSGLQGWWNAGAGVFSDAGSTPAVDTNTIQQWNDQSGNARHFSQATATNRPTYRTSIVNGQPVIRFDGVDNFMATAATMNDMFTSTAGTIFVVAYVTAITTAGAAAYDNDQVFSDQVSGPGIRHCLALKTTPVIVAFHYDGSEDTATKTVATGTWYSMLYKMGGGNVSVGLNDARDASLTSAASGAATSMTGILRLAVNYDSTIFTQIDIAEMAIFNVDVSEANRQAIESGLAIKYGLTLGYSTNSYSSGDLLVVRDDQGNQAFKIDKDGKVYVRGTLVH